MAHPTGESESDVVRLDFNRRLMLQFCGSPRVNAGAFFAGPAFGQVERGLIDFAGLILRRTGGQPIMIPKRLFGESDEGDPWCIVCEREGERVLLHIQCDLLHATKKGALRSAVCVR